MERPYTYVIALCSADGKTAPPPEVNKKGRKAIEEYLTWGIQKPEEAIFKVHKLRAEVDAILVGDRTIMIDDSELTVRVPIEGAKNPLRVVASQWGDIPLTAKVLDTEKAKTLVALPHNAPKENVGALKKKGVDVFMAGEEMVDMKELMRELVRRKVKKLLVEGGATIRWTFFSQGLVDEFWLWLQPAFWGGDMGIARGGSFIDVKDMVKMELKNQYIFGGNIIGLEYKILK